MIGEILANYLHIFATKNSTRTEADIQMNIGAFLTTAPIGLGTNLVSSVEEQLGDGTRRRLDITYGKLVIEVKKDLSNDKVLSDAKIQLSGYLQTLERQEGHQFAGILTDGCEWKLYAHDKESGLLEVDSHTVHPSDSDAVDRLCLWLETILVTGEKLSPTPKSIRQRLGTDSPRFKLDRARLASLFQQNSTNPELGVKKQLWARLLRTALGISFEDDSELFLDHTLLVVEAEIIAHLVIGEDPMKYSPRDLVSGSVFVKAGILNVVEEDFFDWITDVPEGEEFILSLVRELKQFNWEHVEHDVLKVLYEAIIEKDVRKHLGEYYTPDWLAKKIVEETVIDALSQRVMDPACGSGTFVFHAVRRFLAAADKAGIDNKTTLERLQNQVFGMDIHPVSVVLARVTYLLAIGTSRLKDRGALTIPVYLGDSIQWTRGANLLSENNISIEVDSEDLVGAKSETIATLFSSTETLRFPISTLVDPTLFDRLVNDLSALAHTHTDSFAKIPDCNPVLKRYIDPADDAYAVLRETFKTLAILNAEGRDHIWGYFVRNQVRPLWFSLLANRVDVLVGNPPWVAYRFMTEAMQKRFKLMSEYRNLWAGGRVSTHQDLVGLFIARTVEQFLKVGGKFGFVTPFAVLSRSQYQGFREGAWAIEMVDDLNEDSQTVCAEFTTPWDLSDVKPPIFPVPSAVVFGSKSIKATALPSKTKKFEGKFDDLSSSDVEIQTVQLDDVAKSPYATKAIQGAIFTPRCLFIVDRVPNSTSLGAPAGQIRVKSQRSNLEKEPWASLPDVVSEIEEQFVYPILTGSSIASFRLISNLEAVIPIENGKIVDPNELATVAPLMAKRWNEINLVWDTNKGKSKLSLLENLDYQRKLTRQLPSSSERVVYTTSGSTLAASRVTDSRFLIDTKLYWISTEAKAESDYLVAILNSTYLAREVAKLQSRGLFGARDFHTLPFQLNIPKYEASSLQVRISELSSRVAAIAENVEIGESGNFVAVRKQIRNIISYSDEFGELDDLASRLIQGSS